MHISKENTINLKKKCKIVTKNFNKFTCSVAVYFNGWMGGWAWSVFVPFLGLMPLFKTCWANSMEKKNAQN